MKAMEVKKGIYWVGAVDWDIRDFHGYRTPRGTTYNSFLIIDDKITLVDTVKEEFGRVMMDRIRSIIDPSKIDIVVANHVEMDHSGYLEETLKVAKNAQLYCTEKAKEEFKLHFNTGKWSFNTVKSLDTLKVGKRTLTFLETPMLHWPDSMMTYVNEEKLLISSDGFGQHFASSGRFDDEVDQAELKDAAADYYANILMPFGRLLSAKIAQVQKLGLEIDMIAPDHGIIWRKDPMKIITWYLDWANGKTKDKLILVYDTMWHSTDLMTRAIADGAIREGVEVKVVKLRNSPMSQAVKELLEARAVLVGSPTLNNGVFPPVAAFMTYIKGLKPMNKIASAYGSYGWGGGAVKELMGQLNTMGLEVQEPGLEIKFRPDDEGYNKCYEFGKKIAKKIKESK